jgi:hypothetical protein
MATKNCCLYGVAFSCTFGESVGGDKPVRDNQMGSTSLVAVKDKSSEPELEGNIRTIVWDSASAREAVEGEDDQISPGDLIASLRQLSTVSIDEVDGLIRELQTLRRKLQTERERIERDITEYTTLSSQASQLTKIVVDGVKQLPKRA